LQYSHKIGAGRKESPVLVTSLPSVREGLKESAVCLTALVLVRAGKRSECSMYIGSHQLQPGVSIVH